MLLPFQLQEVVLSRKSKTFYQSTKILPVLVPMVTLTSTITPKIVAASTHFLIIGPSGTSTIGGSWITEASSTTSEIAESSEASNTETITVLNFVHGTETREYVLPTPPPPPSYNWDWLAEGQS